MNTTTTTVAPETTEQLIARLTSENAALKEKAKRKVSLKVAEKGGISVYGMGRFPITNYRSQWLVILDMADQIREFISANKAEIDLKEEMAKVANGRSVDLPAEK